MTEGVPASPIGVLRASPPELSQAGVRARAVPVGLGKRVLVVSNLGLGPEARPASSWASSGLARALDAWHGPGIVIVAGNLFDLGGTTDPYSTCLGRGVAASTS